MLKKKKNVILTSYSRIFFSSIRVVKIMGTKDGSVTFNLASSLNISCLGKAKSNVAIISLPDNEKF